MQCHKCNGKGITRKDDEYVLCDVCDGTGIILDPKSTHLEVFVRNRLIEKNKGTNRVSKNYNILLQLFNRVKKLWQKK